MKAQRELRMTVVCKTCEFQYGAWRHRCPTCGALTPVTVHEEAVKKSRPVAIRRAPTRQCVFCHLRAKKGTCPHCNEPIHASCMALHEEACKKFQAELVEAHKAIQA